ncbi:MAG TPA: hypothetical protein VJJ72_01535 [Candidatus Paceibacterota bacterium]
MDVPSGAFRKKSKRVERALRRKVSILKSGHRDLQRHVGLALEIDELLARRRQHIPFENVCHVLEEAGVKFHFVYLQLAMVALEMTSISWKQPVRRLPRKYWHYVK